jgi:undecaprenyl-diphosphatase
MLFIALVQGISEFIPVSSSAHIILAQHFTGLSSDVESDFAVNILLHLGTFVAVIYVYRDIIMELFKNLFSPNTIVRNEALSYIIYIFVASIPVGIAGVGFSDYFRTAFADPQFASAMLLVTAVILAYSGYAREKDTGEITLKTAVIVGIFQVCALFPGISRSGITITTALLLGISRERAGRFSFMIFLPAVGGATFLEIGKITQTDYSAGLLLTGFLTSLIVGILALKILLHFVNRGKLHLFSPYCLILGIIGIIILRI